jgi:hypothetical protein
VSGNDKSEGELIPAKEKNPKQSDFFPAELIALERERITSQDKRTEVARAQIFLGNFRNNRNYVYISYGYGIFWKCCTILVSHADIAAISSFGYWCRNVYSCAVWLEAPV